jgi:hypothetical protein
MINGKPTMLVDATCKIVIDGMLGGYHYPERKPGQANNDNMENPFRDGYYEHLCNTVEYAAINMFKVVELSAERQLDRKYKYRSAVKASNAGFTFAGAR